MFPPSVADNLLEDLQASVSRPGSSLGQPIHHGGGGTYSSTREVQYLQPANVTTVARERSLSPNLQTVSYFWLMFVCFHCEL